MFEQHPVPQNISSYQFRLIGDMTIKQFMELAGGAVVGLLFYASPLPGIFKWPFILASVIFGAALAFLPIQDRPLEQWVLAFLRAIYSPTIFVWQPSTAPAQYYQGAAVATAAATTAAGAEVQIPPPSEPQKPQYLESLEDTEQSFLKNISGLFVKVQQEVQEKQKQQSTPATPQEPFRPTITMPVAPVIVDPSNMPTPIAPLPTQPQSGIQTSLNVPQVAKPNIENRGWTPPPNAGTFVRQENTPSPPPMVGQALPGQQLAQAPDAQFSQEAAPPIPPTSPNIVVGQVKDKEQNIIEGVILEIVDEFGRPVRALKSNRAGHFSIVTPLTNGKYQIKAEKEGHRFDPISLDVKGEVLPPIQLQSK